MKLIKKLPPEYIQGNKRHFGIYECPHCKKEVKKAIGNGDRAKSCGCKKVSGWKQRREENKWHFNKTYREKLEAEKAADYIASTDYMK